MSVTPFDWPAPVVRARKVPIRPRTGPTESRGEDTVNRGWNGQAHGLKMIQASYTIQLKTLTELGTLLKGYTGDEEQLCRR